MQFIVKWELILFDYFAFIWSGSGRLGNWSRTFSCKISHKRSIDLHFDRTASSSCTVAERTKSSPRPDPPVSTASQLAILILLIWIDILFIFIFKVWLCLGISLAVMAPVLTFLSNLYRRYIEKYSNPNPSRPPIRRPIFDFYSLLHNFSFLLSLITNQGNSIVN